MEVELADVHSLPKKNSTTDDLRVFAKDEAVLARFGKRQQLRVSALPKIINHSTTSFGIVLPLIFGSQRDFGLLPVIGLTSTLMISWEAITA